MDSESSKNMHIRYLFELRNKPEKEFEVTIDSKSLNIILPDRNKLPLWTELSFYQCGNCPLSVNESPHCPAALSMIDVIQFFSDMVSFDEANIRVETESRTYSKYTSLQVGVSSLIGLCMATSGCPVLSVLKPMARFHLPFASVEDTVFRALSTYLLGQHIRSLNGLEPDWNLSHLEKMYDEIHTVNLGFSERLKHIKIHDTSLNAIHILDTFANFVRFEIANHVLKELETIMGEFLKD